MKKAEEITTINAVEQNEVIDHIGDLNIEGDVGENAKINLRDGKLIISGDVKEGVEIRLVLSDEFKEKNNGFTSVKKYNKFGIFESFNNININESVKIKNGKTNINNRIYTEEFVTRLGNNRYKITSKVPDKRYITVYFDHRQYIGEEFIIDLRENKIFNGLNLLKFSEHPKQTFKEPPKLIIHGNLENNISITSDVPIEILQDVGEYCQIISSDTFSAKNIGKHVKINAHESITVENVRRNCELTSQLGGLIAGNLEKDVIVSVKKSIDVKDIGKRCQLKSSEYGLTAGNLCDEVNIEVRNAIKVQEVGNYCKFVSENYGLTAKNIGSNVNINVHDAIKVSNIGSNSTLSSSHYGLEGGMVGDNVIIKVCDAIKVRKIGNSCNLLNENYGIEVEGDIGNNSELCCRDNISSGNIGDGCHLTSRLGKMRVLSLGCNTILSANDSIHAQNVGNGSRVYSSFAGVIVQNVGDLVAIVAKKDIEIEGTYSKKITLNSHSGRIIKKPNLEKSDNIQEILPKKQSISNISIIEDYNNNINKNDDDEEIPESYKCPITLEIMKDPVIDFDGNSYERSAILVHLKAYGNSPITRNPMGEKDLIPNRALKNSIENFLAEREEKKHSNRMV